MTRSEAVVMIQEQLGFRSDLSANIIRYLQLAQQTLEKGPTLPWFLKSERSYIYTTSGEERVPVPNNFLRESEGSQLVYVPTDTEEDKVFLDKDTADQLELVYQRETGAPEAYALDGEYFRIFPTPDDAYQIRMVYMKKGVLLNVDVENEWLKHLPYLLMGVTGGLIAGPLRDKAAAAVFSGWAQEGMALMLRENEAREHTNMDYQMGGPE